ncbi:uncharacterized protein LOC111281355 [Durio zibethinus]|uniref:Uncharacterized protein LOC111281355 n=1 Tax=Durio zibethinus TaxID=66656 RepID=A0A6P5X985_DURZI|nr:uncharacterized protein LOC111281355 [Durio zibethinus]
MGGESINDPIVIQSSIALLQERFRRLQRMKELREERELLRKLAEPKQCSPTLPYDQPSGLLFFHFLPPRSPPRQVPNFSLFSGPQSKCHAGTTFRCMEAPFFASLLPIVTETSPSLHVSQNKLKDSDSDDGVDTSLHL